jgi:hypothetical protein
MVTILKFSNKQRATISPLHFMNVEQQAKPFVYVTSQQLTIVVSIVR